MRKINCKNCDGKCCTSKIRKLAVVLTPREERERELKKYSAKIKTKYGALTILKRKISGECIFYDSSKNICKIYKNRPFDCRVYPLIIYFNKTIKFKLDKKVCQNSTNLCLKDFEKIKGKWINKNLPLNWIKAYSTFD